jgi:hypothetical protein
MLLQTAAPDEFQIRRFAEWADVLTVDIDKSEIANVIIVASLTVGSKSYLYAGILERVLWNEPTGEPEWLILSSPMRRNVDDDQIEEANDESGAEDEESRWYNIAGESFMLRYSKVDTLNLIYTLVTESDLDVQELAANTQESTKDNPNENIVVPS